MEEEHRAILRKHRVAILKDLEVKKVLNRLTVLGDEDRDEIKAGRTRMEQASALLDMLPRKGSNAFKDFLSALFEIAGQEHLAKLLIKDSGMEISSFSKGEIISFLNPRVHSAKTLRRSYAKGFESVRRVGHHWPFGNSVGNWGEFQILTNR